MSRLVRLLAECDVAFARACAGAPRSMRHAVQLGRDVHEAIRDSGLPFVDGPLPEPWIRCSTCGAVSFNPNDVMQRYCGRCHAYHVEVANG